MGAAASAVSTANGAAKASRDVHWACRKGDVAALQLMIKDKVNLNVPDNGSWTPLFWGCSEGHLEIVRLLLDSGAEVDRAHGRGGTALMTAAFKGYDAIVKLLLDRNADCDRVNHDGETPLHVASRQGHSRVVRLLLDGNADVTKQSSSRKSPLDMALNTDIRRMITEMSPVQVRSRRPSVFYHATSLQAALCIQAEGFRVDLSGTNAGARLGPGVYCTTMMKKAMNYCDDKKTGGGIIFELDVDLGRCKTLLDDDPMMTTWQASGFDSAWAPPASGQNGLEENCVKDPRRITITRAIAAHSYKLKEAGYDILGGKIVKLEEAGRLLAEKQRRERERERERQGERAESGEERGLVLLA